MASITFDPTVQEDIDFIVGYAQYVSRAQDASETPMTFNPATQPSQPKDEGKTAKKTPPVQNTDDAAGAGETTPETKTKPEPEQQQAKKDKPTKQVAKEEPEATAPQEDEPVVDDTADETEAGITLDSVRDGFRALIRQGKRKEGLAILTAHEVRQVRQLKDDQLETVHGEIQQLLAETDD